MNKKIREYFIEIDKEDSNTEKIMNMALEKLKLSNCKISKKDLGEFCEYTIEGLICKQIDQLSKEMSKIQKEMENGTTFNS